MGKIFQENLRQTKDTEQGAFHGATGRYPARNVLDVGLSKKRNFT